jgi:hypothetical protein
MLAEKEKADREKKLKSLEVKIRTRRFYKLKEELDRVRDYLLKDIEELESTEEGLPQELNKIREELLQFN